MENNEQNTRQLFQNPTAPYRGKPFWSWNGKLEKEELFRQMQVLKEMGMGGYFCHSRTGLATEYLGEEWFALTNEVAKKGAQMGMETWLYDEDRWPSGTAGGMVTKEKAFRIHYLRQQVKTGKDFTFAPEMVAAFTVTLTGQSFVNKRRLTPGEEVPPEATVLFYTIEEQREYSFYNGQTYVDTMNPLAVRRFLELTHQQYWEKAGGEIQNGHIKGVFTDEPHHGGVMNGFALHNEQGENLTPCPEGLFTHFQNRYGYDLADFLPDLYLLPNWERVVQVKWQYMELLNELFNENYLSQLQQWCHEHSLQFTGHLLHEDSLAAQAVLNGSLLRGYERMDIPGVDVLWEKNPKYFIAKQLQSVGRQFNKPWLLSELYGCTGWQMTFFDHKTVGDWQAFMGINLRCHHLCWYTMAGEAKRDYPGSIFYQAEWYQKYKYVEDYFSRLHVFLEGGAPLCETLVLSPVESFWASIRPGWINFLDAADPTLRELEQNYEALFWALLGNHTDFDYGDEEQLGRLGRAENGEILLGAGRYKTVIVPDCLTLRASTLALLEQLTQQGGKVLFTGRRPGYVDAVTSSRAAFIGSQTDLQGLPALLPHNPEISVSSSKVLVTVKKHVDKTVFMLLNIDRENEQQGVEIQIAGEGTLEEWNARTGETALLPGLAFARSFAPGEELLLVRRQNSAEKTMRQMVPVRKKALTGPFAYRLAEPNMAVLDTVSWHYENGPWSEVTDILKADHALRGQLGLPWRSGEMLQPWYVEKEGLIPPRAGRLTLRYAFASEAPLTGAKLMLESPAEFNVTLNGLPLSTKRDEGWHIDPCFRLFPLPDLAPGSHVLELTCRFGPDVNLEAIYLVGAFGVKTNGNKVILTTLPETLALGDISGQGLPFYSGAVDYQLPMAEKGARLKAAYGGACAEVPGSGLLAFAGETLPVEGEPILRVHLTRRNTFGPLHVNPPRVYSYGPETFVTEGDAFMADGFSLIENGLLAAEYQYGE